MDSHAGRPKAARAEEDAYDGDHEGCHVPRSGRISKAGVTSALVHVSTGAETSDNGEAAAEAAAIFDKGANADVNFIVRFGFTPVAWQRPGAQEEADEHRSGGDAFSRSSSFSSGDGSVQGMAAKEEEICAWKLDNAAPSAIARAAVGAAVPDSGEDWPQNAAVLDEPAYANANFIVRFGFTPPGWQRPGAQKEADDDRSGGDPLSRSTSCYSGDGSTLGGLDERLEEVQCQEHQEKEHDSDELNIQTDKAAVCSEKDENQGGEEQGSEAKKLNQLADSSFALTSASGPVSFASRSSAGGSWQSEASLGPFASVTEAHFPKAPAGHSKFAAEASGPLLERELDVEAATRGDAAPSARDISEAVRVCATWRVAVPVFALACTVGGVVLLTSQ